MKIIYLVTEGEYSDYGIEAVFSTEELAQAYIDTRESHKAPDGKKYYGYCEYKIEQYPIDERVKETEQKVFVSILDEDGEYRANRGVWSYESLTPPRYSMSEIEDHYGSPVYFRGESVVSKEHAHKMSVEARQRWLREKSQ